MPAVVNVFGRYPRAAADVKKFQLQVFRTTAIRVQRRRKNQWFVADFQGDSGRAVAEQDCDFLCRLGDFQTVRMNLRADDDDALVLSARNQRIGGDEAVKKARALV